MLDLHEIDKRTTGKQNIKTNDSSHQQPLRISNNLSVKYLSPSVECLSSKTAESGRNKWVKKLFYFVKLTKTLKSSTYSKLKNNSSGIYMDT